MPQGQGYKTVGATLGDIFTGGDVDRQGAYIEGLELGSKIKYQNAQTANAIAQARQRRRDVDRQEELDGNIEMLADALGADESVVRMVIAGHDPGQVTGPMLEVQERDNRNTIADPSLPFANRQAAAQAVSGQPLEASDFLGPGGELFVDLFSEPSVGGVKATPTGEAQIRRDDAFAQESLADALLADEKRQNPEKFRSPGTVVQLGGLPDSITSPEGGLNLGDDPSDAFGVTGVFGSAANLLGDVVPGLGQPFPDVAQTKTAVDALRENSMVTGTLDFPGRPTNFIAQRVDALFPPAASIFQGEESARTKIQQLRDLMARERDAQQALLPTIQTKSNIDKATSSIAQLSQLVADYEQLLSAMDAKGGADMPAFEVVE